MNVEIPVSNLTEKLSFLNHAISTRSQLPILSNFLLTAKDNKLKLSATDLEIGIESFVKSTVIEEGGITVPARAFTDLVNSIPDSTIILLNSGNSLEVVSKRSKSVFQTISKDDFPKLYEERGELLTIMNERELRNAFSKVLFSASADTTRPALSGILVRKVKLGFLLVATDGFRLSMQHYRFDRARDDIDKSIIVPARVFRELMVIKDEKKEVEMFVSEGSNQVLFEQGESVLVGRLIDAQFPDFERIIPSDFSLNVSFNRDELLSAVRICSIFSKSNANIVKFGLQKDRIIVSSSTASVGGNTVDVEASLTGEENGIAFNTKYLLDLLSNIDADEMTFEMIGPLNPGVFKIKGDESFLHLIMPIRTGQ